MMGSMVCDKTRKAMKLWLRAGELGHAMAYDNIGYAYDMGKAWKGMRRKLNITMSLQLWGECNSKVQSWLLEERAGNMSRAVKHWMISAGAGHDESLKAIRECFLDGHATKDDFEKALRAHKEAKDEMKSDQREAAASELD